MMKESDGDITGLCDLNNYIFATIFWTRNTLGVQQYIKLSMHRDSECLDCNSSIVKSTIDNYQQSEILFRDVKMENTPIIQVSSI